MRIGHYVSMIARMPGYERNVSGHIQVPLQAVRLLTEARHESHIITTATAPDRVMPDFLPEEAHLHFVVDSRRRRWSLGMKHKEEQRGVHPGAFVRQVLQVAGIVREHRLDVLHVYGFHRTALFGGLLRSVVPCPVVATIYDVPTSRNPLARILYHRLDAVVTATEYVAEGGRRFGLPVQIIRHGTVRRLLSELEGPVTRERHRVLFWRNPTLENGTDNAMKVFDALAPRYPEVSFDFAVRHSREEVPLLEELASRHANIHLHRFPYDPGVNLARLLAESICVLLPFRSLSINPQFALLESLEAGVPVVTTRLESIPEIMQEGETGFIVGVEDDQEMCRAIEYLLRDRSRARRMGEHARSQLERSWNWSRYVQQVESVYSAVAPGRTQVVHPEAGPLAGRR